jgi:hypothetical protein
MATDLQVNIASEFKGKKAFTDAEKALNKLTGGAKKLAGALGVAYGVKAVLAYSKASMKAAAQDQKAQKILASNLKNLGLAYASVDAESFIKSMETQTAVLDDQLRPAYSQLATVTGSATKTQELMKLAFDVSSGSGLDYASTVDILSQAYIGNTKGLKQLNLGLTQAELKAMDFEQISTKLRQNFAGAGGVALDSYAGSMAKLNVATSNASETIGTALLDAIIKTSGSNGVDGLVSKIDTLASAFASVVTQVGNAVSALTGTETRKAFSPGYYVSGGRAGGKTVAPTGAGNMALSVLSQDTQKSDLAAKKKAELDAIKRNKELAALAKAQAKSAADQLKAKRDQAALDKAALVLGKGQDVFNMDAIQIQAALLSKQDEINKLGVAATDQQKMQLANDLVRLTVKQDILKLEDAIAAKDVEGATALAAKLNKDLMILGTLQGQALKLADINNILNSFKPKDLINLENLNQALALLAAMAGIRISPQAVAAASGGKAGGTTGGGTSGSTAAAVASLIPGVDYNPGQNKDRNYDIINQVAQEAASSAMTYFAEKGSGRGAGAGEGQIPAGAYNITVNAGVVGSENIIVDAVQNALNEIARRGYSTTYAGAIAV